MLDHLPDITWWWALYKFLEIDNNKVIARSATSIFKTLGVFETVIFLSLHNFKSTLSKPTANKEIIGNAWENAK